MKKYRSIGLLEQLQSDTRQLILAANYLQTTDPGLLSERPAPGKWSVVQILAHLNSYGTYYLLALERSLEKDQPATEFFKPGWLGNYFTKLMKPGENDIVANKMQSPKNHRPSNDLDALPVLAMFLEQQHYLLGLLELAKSKNISRLHFYFKVYSIESRGYFPFPDCT